jgi:hypothetical protein
MWLRLCSIGNRAVVRVLLPQLQSQTGPDGRTSTATCSGLGIDPRSLYWGDAVGADGASVFAGATVMDQRGNLVSGIDAGNLQPTCVKYPTDPSRDTPRKADPGDAETHRHPGRCDPSGPRRPGVPR